MISGERAVTAIQPVRHPAPRAWGRNAAALHCRPNGGGSPTSYGFTLTECLVCLAVLGIVVWLCTATLVRLIPRERLNHAARTVVALCRQARIEAIKTNRRMNLECDSAANICRLTDSGTGRLVDSVDFAKPEYGVIMTRSFRTNFSGRGNAAPAGKVVIRNDAGDTRSITVRTSGGVVTK